ncbi:hypothetical protein TNCV_789231 [Trichonephila clavipes]|nr:hypothetical protein TNCV_789231 [Trichonephila clavipes]
MDTPARTTTSVTTENKSTFQGSNNIKENNQENSSPASNVYYVSEALKRVIDAKETMAEGILIIKLQCRDGEEVPRDFQPKNGNKRLAQKMMYSCGRVLITAYCTLFQGSTMSLK